MSRKSQRNGGDSGQGWVYFSKTIKTSCQRFTERVAVALNLSPRVLVSRKTTRRFVLRDRPMTMFSFSGLTTIGVKRPTENRCKVSRLPGRGDIGRVSIMVLSSWERRGRAESGTGRRGGFHGEHKIGSDECVRCII